VSTEAIILAGVSIYLVAMLVIGITVAKRAGTQDDFLVAGRKLPLWICAPTMMATWFGGGTMLGAAGTGYEGGLLASIAIPFGAALVLILMGFFIARTMRRMRLLTVAEFFENRFGHMAGLVATSALLLAIIGWIGGTMVGFGYVLQTLDGPPDGTWHSHRWRDRYWLHGCRRLVGRGADRLCPSGDNCHRAGCAVGGCPDRRGWLEYYRPAIAGTHFPPHTA